MSHAPTSTKDNSAKFTAVVALYGGSVPSILEQATCKGFTKRYAKCLQRPRRCRGEARCCVDTSRVPSTRQDDGKAGCAAWGGCAAIFREAPGRLCRTWLNTGHAPRLEAPAGRFGPASAAHVSSRHGLCGAFPAPAKKRWIAVSVSELANPELDLQVEGVAPEKLQVAGVELRLRGVRLSFVRGKTRCLLLPNTAGTFLGNGSAQIMSNTMNYYGMTTLLRHGNQRVEVAEYGTLNPGGACRPVQLRRSQQGAIPCDVHEHASSYVSNAYSLTSSPKACQLHCRCGQRRPWFIASPFEAHQALHHHGLEKRQTEMGK